MRLILRLLINAVALLAITQILEGFEVDGFWAAVVAAIILGILNAVVRPVLILLTLPINIVTLGLFTFVINAFIIWGVATWMEGFEVDGFLPALFAAIILWLVSWLTNVLIYDDKEM